MNRMLRALGLLWLTITMGGATLVETLRVVMRHVGRTPAQVYLAGLRNVALVVVLAPLLLVYAGVVRDNDVLVIAAGIIWVIASALLWVLGSYVALLIDALLQLVTTQKFELQGKKYVRFLFGVLITEIFVTIAAIVLPWEGNIKLAVMAALAGLGLAMVYHLDDRDHHLWRKTMEWSFLGFLVLGFLYLVFPGPAEQFIGWFHNVRKSEIPLPSGKEAPDLSGVTRAFIAMPGEWTENFSVPPSHHIRIHPHGCIFVKLWNGRVIKDCPGLATWLGDEVEQANFRVMAAGNAPTQYDVVLVPKRS